MNSARCHVLKRFTEHWSCLAGALVQMVTMTVSDMRWFVLLLFVVMFGFGTSFLVLFSGVQERSPEFADVDNALLSMFLFMLGSFNMEAFDLASVPSAAILLFVFYEVLPSASIACIDSASYRDKKDSSYSIVSLI